ncbi:hypothetical protein Tco_0336917 [Tanacetum coccineum]
MKCPQHYLTKMQEVILFYNGLDIQIMTGFFNLEGAFQLKMYRGKTGHPRIAEYFKKAQWSLRENIETMTDWLLFKHKLNNLERDQESGIRLDNHYCEEEGNYGPKFMEAYGALISFTQKKEERIQGRLGELVHTKLTLELVDMTVKYPKGIVENVLVGIEGKVIEEFRTRNDDLDTGVNDYPSYCDDDKKIHIDLREGNIDEYWWRIYESGNLEMLES